MLADLILGHTPVCAVEWDPYCCEVLREQVADGWFPGCAIWQGDVRAFPAEEWAGRVDCVHAGFPCQPHSVAGKRKGAEDDRNLWPATADIVGRVRPGWVFLENVPGLVSNGFIGTVLGDLARLGYDAQWTVLGADDVGATHRRKRWWCLAYRTSLRCDGLPAVGGGFGESQAGGRMREPAGGSYDVDYALPGRHRDEDDALRTGRDGAVDAGGLPVWPPAPSDIAGWRDLLDRWPELAPAVEHAKRDRCERFPSQNSNRVEGSQSSEEDRQPEARRVTATPRDSGDTGEQEQAPESSVRGVADGMANRVQRLKALGNGQVPLAAAAAWVMLGGP